MKKILFITLGIFALNTSVTAQDAETTKPQFFGADVEQRNFYVAFGVSTIGDFKINDNLRAQGLPQIEGAPAEFTFGFAVMLNKVLVDMELNSNYTDKKTSTDRLKSFNTAFKIRTHYVPFKTDKMFFSAGVDLSYLVNNFNLYTQGNTIDMNDLNPSAHTGHISLNNEMFYAGPSAAFGFFQKSEFPLRLNVGYEWALISGSWKSEYAKVDNSFKENGAGRFYAKVAIYLN